MRTAILLTMLLLLSTAASAFTTKSIVQGTEPVVYGNIIAFLTLEDSINKDLNHDSDQADRVLQYYNVQEGKVISTGTEGTQLAIHGSMLAFAGETRILKLYDIEAKKFIEAKARGTTPSLYKATVALATLEEDVGLDLNGDDDTRDTIIRSYDIDREIATNTKAVGENPLMLDDFLVFATRENKAEEDLNNDGDLDDTIIRALDFDTNQVVNTRVTGTNPVGYKHETIIVTDNQKFWALDLQSGEKQPTGVFGNDPALYQDMLVYERDGMLMLYRLSTGVEMPLGIAGKDPAVFDNLVVFIGKDKTVTLLKGEDPDKDNVPDFADNCPDMDNADQSDKDKDGIGDACDETPLPEEEKAEPAEPTAPPVTAKTTAEQPVEPVFTTQAEQQPAAQPAERKAMPDTLALEKNERGPTYWFLIAAGLTIIGVVVYFLVPRWLQKRRKSFGF